MLPRGGSDVCGICFEDGFKEMVLYETSTLKNNGMIQPCHSFCLDCFKKHAQISVKERKLNFDRDGTYLPCPVCQSETKNWNCHVLYLAGESIYNLFQKVSTEYTIVKNLKNGIICPNPKCGAGFESDIDYIGASIKCPECKFRSFFKFSTLDGTSYCECSFWTSQLRHGFPVVSCAV